MIGRFLAQLERYVAPVLLWTLTAVILAGVVSVGWNMISGMSISRAITATWNGGISVVHGIAGMAKEGERSLSADGYVGYVRERSDRRRSKEIDRMNTVEDLQEAMRYEALNQDLRRAAEGETKLGCRIVVALWDPSVPRDRGFDRPVQVYLEIGGTVVTQVLGAPGYLETWRPAVPPHVPFTAVAVTADGRQSTVVEGTTRSLGDTRVDLWLPAGAAPPSAVASH